GNHPENTNKAHKNKHEEIDMAEITTKSPAEEAFVQGVEPDLQSAVQAKAPSTGRSPSARAAIGAQADEVPQPRLPNASEFLQRYELARKEHVSPYNWLPPEWNDGDPAPTLPDTVSEDVPFPNEADSETKYKKNRARLAEQQPGDEEPPPGGKLEK